MYKARLFDETGSFKEDSLSDYSYELLLSNGKLETGVTNSYNYDMVIQKLSEKFGNEMIKSINITFVK